MGLSCAAALVRWLLAQAPALRRGWRGLLLGREFARSLERHREAADCLDRTLKEMLGR
ncbi:hypothetical protein [Tropicimonas sp. IMCC34043]|uniref:hypothetical protein n=1 Tax=Tropicimonas sp. IMCC34043 TaxID=2248760 RepID=UPI0013004D81|nr:hypothetical protein [Tropicimonas sp. IMCC34043]